MSETTTIILYISTIILTTIFGFFSQKKVENNEKIKFRFIWFILAFLISFCIAVFNKIGADYENYCLIIKNSKKLLDASYVECGFNGLAYMLYNVFKNADVVYCLIKGIAVIIFYKAFYTLKDDIPVWMAIFCYNVFAFWYFFLLSMTLASAFMLLSIAYLLKENNIKSIFSLIIACLIHSSCILIIPAYVLYYIFGKNKEKKISKSKVLFSIFMYLIIIILGTFFYNIFINNVPALQQYQVYQRYKSEGIGLMFFARYLPIIYFLYKIYLYNNNNTMTNISIIFSITGIFFAIMSYQFSVVSRMFEHFISIQCFFIPYYCMQIKNAKGIVGKKLIITQDELIWIMYIFILGTYDFFTIINYEKNMISQFMFFNPF